MDTTYLTTCDHLVRISFVSVSSFASAGSVSMNRKAQGCNRVPQTAGTPMMSMGQWVNWWVGGRGAIATAE